MSNTILNFSRLIAYRQREPQPRVHKCGTCGRKFKCAPCTRKMRYGKIQNHPLWSDGCSGVHNQYGDNSKSFLCARCK